MVVEAKTQNSGQASSQEPVSAEEQAFWDRVQDPEARAFLGRVLTKVPARGEGVKGCQFHSWPQGNSPTHEAVVLKVIPGADPESLIARIMDVDGYKGRIAHVEECRSQRGSNAASRQPGNVRVFQVLNVPGIAKIQQELVLVDAGTIKGYRVVFWSLLKDETRALDPKAGARCAYNVGAWLVAPNVVGYALHSWPERKDVNVVQWTTLTGGADVLAKKVVESNIDGMAAWAKAQSAMALAPK